MIGDIPIPWIVAGVLVAAGGLCRMAAATMLQEWNPFDFIMRGPPLEDLTPGGKVFLILSWLLTAAGVAVILVDRFPHMMP